MWVCRRLEKISWRDEEKSFVDVTCRRKKNLISHIHKGENLLMEVIEGRMIGKDQGEGNDWVC